MDSQRSENLYEGDSRFNTDHTRTIFEAVRSGVPSWCIVVVSDGGIKAIHNIRDKIDDRFDALEVPQLTDGTGKGSRRDKNTVAYALDGVKEVYASYHTFYADIEEGATDRRSMNFRTRGGRNPLNFIWLTIDSILGYDDQTIEFAGDTLRYQLEVIARVVADYDMSSFDVPFQSNTDISVTSYHSWRQAYRKSKKIDNAEARDLRDRIEFMENEFRSGNVPDITDYDQYNSRFRLKPVLINNGIEYEVKISDGVHIFEMSRTTRYVPMIHYQDVNGEDHYKTEEYSMMDVMGATTHRDIAYPKHAKVPKPNYIIFTLWLGDPDDEGLTISQSPINTLISIAYKLNHGTMTIRMDHTQGGRVTSVEVVRDRIAQAFPNLVFGDFIPVGYRGTFNLREVYIDESLLMDQLMNDVYFNQYFYLEDRTMPFYRTGTIILRHISGEVSRQRLAEEVGVKIDITPLSLSSKSELKAMVVTRGVESEQDKTYQPGSVYLRVEINKGIKLATYDHIVLVLKTLLAYHTRSQLEMNEYEWALDEVKYPARRGNIEFSSANYPNILPSDYATLCSYRPVIADRRERREYIIEVDGKEVTRRFPVIAYPHRRLRHQYPHLPIVYLRSNDPVRPYVNIYKLDDTSVHEYRRYYPCCSSSREENVITPEIRTRTEPDSIIDSNSTGHIHPTIKDIIRTVDGSPLDLIKIGVPRGINSLLYCVLNALKIAREDKYYKDKDLIRQAAEDRSRMSQFSSYTWTDDDTPLYLAVAAQQLFDVTEKEVIAMLKSDSFLDPRIFVRIVEEYYNVNIIRFHSSRKKQEPQLTLPRYREFFSYHHRDRPTIIILSHHGTRTTTSRNYPHCELIAIKNVERDQMPDTLFSTSMGKILTRIATENDVGLTWVSDGDIIHQYTNAHTKFDWSQYSIYPTGQVIDNLGKVSALRFQHILGSGIMLIPPYEPFNVPVVTDLEPLMSYKIAIQIFGNPDSWDIDDGKIFGMWYHQSVNKDVIQRGVQLEENDYSFKFYICTREDSFVDITSDSDEQVQLQTLLSSEGYDIEPILGERNLVRYGIQDLNADIMKNYLTARKTSYLIRTLMKWLFRIQFIVQGGDLSPQQFMDEFTLLADGTELYDISKFTSQLPLFDNIDDALIWIGTMDAKMTSVNSSNNIVFTIYTQAYYNVLLEELRVFRRVLDNTEVGELNFERENISNFYTPWEKEMNTGGEVSITSKASFDQWIDFQEYIVGNRVYTIISNKLRQSSAPFVYALESERSITKYYLVQNVFRSRPSQALAVASYIANHWVNSSPRINLGPNRIEEREDFNPSEVLDYAITQISANGIIVKITDSVQSPALVLKYTNNRYAALLQLGAIKRADN